MPKRSVARNTFTVLVFGTGFCAVVAAAADRTSQVEKIEERLNVIEREFSIFRELTGHKLQTQEKAQTDRLEAQDKRLTDFGAYTTQQANNIAQQANSIASISNNTAQVGNYIAWTSAGIAFVVFLAGLATYVTATRQAAKKAHEAVDAWFLSNGGLLETRLANLEAKASDGAKVIDDSAGAVAETATAAQATIHQIVSDLYKLVPGLLTSAKSPNADSIGVAENVEANAALKEIADKALVELRAKEAVAADSTHVVEGINMQTTSKLNLAAFAERLYAVGIGLFADRAYEYALQSFDMCAEVGELAKPKTRVACLFARAVTLGLLNKQADELLAYEEIDRQFHDDSDGLVRTNVANALYNKAVTLGQRGDTDAALATYEDIERRFGKDQDSLVRQVVAKAAVNRASRLSNPFGNSAATAAFDAVAARFNADEDPLVLCQVAFALSGASFNRIAASKQAATEGRPLSADLLGRAEQDLQKALSISDNNNSAMIRGNLGYCYFLMGDTERADEHTRAAASAADTAWFENQKGDADVYRIEPTDSQYVVFLSGIWAAADTSKLGNEGTPPSPAHRVA